MNILLAVTNYSERIPIDRIGDSLSFGGMMLGIGMLAVFSVLCLIWGALVLFKIFFYDLPAKKKVAATAVEAPAPVSAAPAAPSQNDEEELIAVLAAAIAMAESESNGAKFKVVSFRRK